MREPARTDAPSPGVGACARCLLSVCVVLLLTLLTALAQTNVAIPPPAEILKSLRQEHPRLLANLDEFRALKKRATDDAQLRRWHAQVCEARH